MNFALILFVLLVITGILWCLDRFKYRKLRAPGAKEPLWVDWGAGFFPVILIVFVLRSFLFEPFKIPSGSMVPTLLEGDFILVNKYTYGIRLPVINKKIIDIASPQRGDVMVFRYPEDPSMDYIKRVVGLPGDQVAYQNKQLTINGTPVPTSKQADYQYKLQNFRQFSEKLGQIEHRIMVSADAPPFVDDVAGFPFRENCNYNHSGVICTVPPGHYFMLGDNRDNSRDSRYWGFVPEENIVGRAFLIWMNFSDPRRIGSFK